MLVSQHCLLVLWKPPNSIHICQNWVPRILMFVSFTLYTHSISITIFIMYSKLVLFSHLYDYQTVPNHNHFSFEHCKRLYILATQIYSTGRHFLEACWKCRISDPSPDLLNQNLHLNKIHPHVICGHIKVWEALICVIWLLPISLTSLIRLHPPMAYNGFLFFPPKLPHSSFT